MRVRLVLTTLLLSLSLHGATLTDAKRVVTTLNAILAAHDEDQLRAAFGPTAYRRNAGGPVLWKNMQEEVAGLQAVLAHPVRTFSAEGIVTVFGWQDQTLYAAHFITRRGTLVAEALIGIRTARTPAEREVIATFIRTLTEDRLRRAFVDGEGSVINRIKREVGALLQPQPPEQSVDSLDALLRRYERVWFAHDCSQLSRVYDQSATWKDWVNNFTYDGLQQFCAQREPRPECSLKLVSQAPTATGVTARVQIWCSVNATSGTSTNKTLHVTMRNGDYRILREEETE